MSLCSQKHLGFALTLLVAGQFALFADDAAKGPPTPIIFSSPKSDTVSSNLNQMGTKSSSLMDLESGLKKPFEIFDSSRSSGGFQPPNRFTQPSAPAINKKLKDVLDKRVEDSYLLSDDKDSEISRDESMNADREALDPASGRPKTSLDRYYDRIDRMRAGTNQTSSSLSLLGEKSDPNEKEDARSRKSGGLFDSELSANARGLDQMPNSLSEGGRLSLEKLKERSSGDIFGLGPAETTQPTGRIKQKDKETRLDEFKRLLDGPGYGGRSAFNAMPPPSSSQLYQPPKSTVSAPASSLSVGSQPSSSFAKPPGFSGAVGMPVGVPEFAASSPSLSTPPPPPTQKPPVPKFEPPRRRF